MSESPEVMKERAENIYQNIIQVLESLEVNFQRDNEKRVCHFTYKNNDMNHQMILAVREDRGLIHLVNFFPFNADKSKYPEMFEAICRVNCNLMGGRFGIDVDDGRLSYEMFQRFDDSIISPNTIKEMILVATGTVERYDDRLFGVNKGFLAPEKADV